jgi:AcrR family transcriptional regulator
MSEPVKPTRTYRSERRREQALETRGRVLDAAWAVFVERGYGGATIRAIATEAGVAPETIYAGFGTKRDLLAETLSRAARGDDPAPVLEQAGPRAVADEEDPREKLRLFATDIAARLERAGPIMNVLASAAAEEPELGSLHARMHAARRSNLRTVAESLQDAGALSGDVESATDTIWALTSPELFMLLRTTRGWTRRTYARWLEETLARLVLQ